MQRPLTAFAVGLVTAVILSAPAEAATITIDAAEDATIFQNNVDNSNGAGPGMFAGTNGMGSPRRGLIQFDIAANIPARVLPPILVMPPGTPGSFPGPFGRRPVAIMPR
jgi:hypothetical protein